MFDILGKLQEAQGKMQEMKANLANVTIDGDAGDGAVKVVVTGNREVKSIEVAERLLAPEHKEELEDLLITALNRALKNAENSWENEMKSMAGGMLGGLGGLF
jgi:nucleoid-associated protein EbfC